MISEEGEDDEIYLQVVAKERAGQESEQPPIFRCQVGRYGEGYMDMGMYLYE